MDNEKKTGFEGEETPSEVDGGNAPRARNRTVMLTPEITGEVRARLAQEMQSGPASSAAPGFGSITPESAAPSEPPSSGFGGSYSPAGPRPGGEEPPMTTRPGPEAFGTLQPESPGPRFSAPQTPVAPQTPIPPASRASTSNQAIWTSETPIRGFLISFDNNPNGDIFELRTGRLIVTSEAASSGNFLILNDQTVSPMHAILRISADGDIQVLDQLSEHGTSITRFGEDREEVLSGEKSAIDHGDLIKFGDRTFHVCVIAFEEDV